MIDLVRLDNSLKKTFRVGLRLCLLFLFLSTGGCAWSQSITMSNLDDTIEAFACLAAEGANRAGAEITEAQLVITATTVFDVEAGGTIPVVVPITAKGKAAISEGTTLTLTLNLAKVDCSKEPRTIIKAYKVNPDTLKIQKKLFDN